MAFQSIRDGDVFRWSYRSHNYPHGSDPYWCCSRIAVAKGGRLLDTFWHSRDGRSFDPNDTSLELKPLGNLEDYELLPPYRAVYFGSADIMDLRHGNDSRAFYVRKGAPRSREAMLAEAERRLAEAEDKAQSAAFRAASMRELIEKLKSGTDLSEVWL